MADVPIEAGHSINIDPDVGKRLLLVVGLILEVIMMAAGLWPAAWLVLRFGPSAATPGQWVLVILGAVFLFNYGYLVALLLFRILIPRPKEGHHTLSPDGGVSRPVVVFMLNVLLLKARHDPPWAAMFSSVLSRIPPLGGLFTRCFGPRTSSVTMGDAMHCFDPHYVEAGKNVEFGFGCIISPHCFDNRGMLIRKVIIGDHAVIGSQAILSPGVEVGHHAVVGVRSVVHTNTKIGPYEYWAGDPARKIRNLTPGDSADATVRSE
jgi:hypothetical protein